MKQTVTVPEVEEVTVDLFGTEFATRAATKSLAKTAGPLAARIFEADDEEELIDAFGAFLDAKLKSVNGGRRRPSAIVRRQWDDDKVTIPQLMALLERLRDAETPI